MNLKYLNHTGLDQRMKSLAQKERNLLHEVLITIKEIDSRRTFLEIGFGSLFDYLVAGIGYSEGSAQRRIDAARLIREVPQIAEKIQSGELKLNQVSLVQRAAREIAKNRSPENIKFKDGRISAAQKLEVMKIICNKYTSESQRHVAAFFELPVLQSCHQKVQADESVRVELTLSKEVYSKIQKAQELLSHSLTSQDIGQFLELMADKVIQQKMSVKKTDKECSDKKIVSQRISSESPRTNADANTSVKVKNLTSLKDAEKNSHNKLSTATVAVEIVEDLQNVSFGLDADLSVVANGEQTDLRHLVSRSLAVKNIKLLRHQQGCCQYVDPSTGRKCQSTWKLQIDHKKSQWAGGKHELKNLQQLCSAHNKLKYRKEVGIQYL